MLPKADPEPTDLPRIDLVQLLGLELKGGAASGLAFDSMIAIEFLTDALSHL